MARYALADMTLACSRCGQTFVFSAGERELQLLRGTRRTPAYCPACARQMRSLGTSDLPVRADRGRS